MARQKSSLPPFRPPMKLSPEDMRLGIERLRKRLGELDQFDPAQMTESHPPELTALETSIARALEKTFGEATPDLRRFAQAGELQWSPSFYIMGDEPTPLSDYRNGVNQNIDVSRALLNEAIRTLEEDLIEDGEPGSSAPRANETAAASRRVFLVHGHDEGPRESVARFLDRIDFEPVILHEQASKGRTIITKFQEEAADIGFAVVLMTPDDVGGPAGGDTRLRARQNVVFELGFFIGRLGPDRVVAMIKGELERPSDFDGVVYISLDKEDWRTLLGRELKAAGYEIDWNKIMQ